MRSGPRGFDPYVKSLQSSATPRGARVLALEGLRPHVFAPAAISGLSINPVDSYDQAKKPSLIAELHFTI